MDYIMKEAFKKISTGFDISCFHFKEERLQRVVSHDDKKIFINETKYE